MPRKLPQEKLQDLETKRDQINARIERERARLRDTARKLDTRRKIVAGAIVLDHAERDPAFGELLQDLLRRFATRDEDRKLFDLQ